jgi:peptidoglycan-associated lipoprotein
MKARTCLVCCTALTLAACGAAQHTAQRSTSVDTTTVTSSPPMKTPTLVVSGEIISKCGIDMDAVKQPVAQRAPHFDFDKSELLPADYALLDAIAECLDNGPLIGRSVALVGRADPRGEVEYNFVLGAHRADTVGAYLQSRGVMPSHLQTTSRGKLDATGTDEASWAIDRRVDIILL